MVAGAQWTGPQSDPPPIPCLVLAKKQQHGAGQDAKLEASRRVMSRWVATCLWLCFNVMINYSIVAHSENKNQGLERMSKKFFKYKHRFFDRYAFSYSPTSTKLTWVKLDTERLDTNQALSSTGASSFTAASPLTTSCQLIFLSRIILGCNDRGSFNFIIWLTPLWPMRHIIKVKREAHMQSCFGAINDRWTIKGRWRGLWHFLNRCEDRRE